MNKKQNIDKKQKINIIILSLFRKEQYSNNFDLKSFITFSK